jgi:hypothetical protein
MSMLKRSSTGPKTPVVSTPSTITAIPATCRTAGTPKSGAPMAPIEVPTTTKTKLKPAMNSRAWGRMTAVDGL